VPLTCDDGLLEIRCTTGRHAQRGHRLGGLDGGYFAAVSERVLLQSGHSIGIRGIPFIPCSATLLDQGIRIRSLTMSHPEHEAKLHPESHSWEPQRPCSPFGS
jgi:hypothetical protein